VKEIQQILKKTLRFAHDEKAILATVVDVQGSSYRLPGAKMLITETGETFGTVSGGCLEADLLERAKEVIKTSIPQVFLYDTNVREDSVFSLNLGCRGVIRILLEPFSDEYVRKLRNALESRQNFVNAVVIKTDVPELFPLGKRFFTDSADDFSQKIFANSDEVLAAPRSFSKIYQTEKATLELFWEIIKPPLNLLIFGAGADAGPLSVIAKNLGWHVTVVDHRPAYASSERFPEADEILIVRPENIAEILTPDENTAAVVMTHNYESDKYVQKFLLNTNIKYIGALGPKKRTEKLLAEIGENWTENLYAPVGLDIGAETPEEIALAIVAEIQTVLNQRAGGFLRDKKTGIH
jgi:xanthine/CO dehydrogenase XdhC/CoxF family maturation factor